MKGLDYHERSSKGTRREITGEFGIGRRSYVEN
jgi:hypothetical protein